MATMEAHVPTAEKQPPALVPQVVEAPHDVVKEKSVISPHPVPTPLEKFDVSKAPPSPPLADKIPDPPGKRTSLGPNDRDVALANVEKEKSLSFIKAWEESEKTKVDNKAQKKLADVAAWENTKKAALEAKLKKLEEELEKKKADYAEKMHNKVALIHKEAQEKRAMVEAKRGEEMLKAEELAAKHRATGTVPKKLGCLGC
ncbi:remorin-like isoform X2 [Rhododendron vialii]|uniref:remorin-like isoform X2 n=1 Tax=Rhododendron vialii TaxID=182163 RepID=UPI00265F9AFF|nr:remorin-like isoform X2 [Rhododendron vialii]